MPVYMSHNPIALLISEQICVPTLAGNFAYMTIRDFPTLGGSRLTGMSIVYVVLNIL